MDFREGGYWLYAMVGPNGEQHWARTDYQSIRALKGYLAIDGFCDEQGVINKELPQNKWETKFNPHADSTLVDIQLSFDTLADLEKIIEMGFEEGFVAALENLDELLASK